jgi:hypothetical protein
MAIPKHNQQNDNRYKYFSGANGRAYYRNNVKILLSVRRKGGLRRLTQNQNVSYC